MKTLTEAVQEYRDALQTTRTIYPPAANKSGFDLRLAQAKRALPLLFKEVGDAYGRETSIKYLTARPDQLNDLVDLIQTFILSSQVQGIVVSADLLYKAYTEEVSKSMGKAGFGMTQWSMLVGLLRATATDFDFDDLVAPPAKMGPVKPEELQPMIRNLVRDSNGDLLAALFAGKKTTNIALDADLEVGSYIFVIGLQKDNAQAFRNYFLGGDKGEVFDVTALLDDESSISDDLAALLGIGDVTTTEAKPKRKYTKKATTTPPEEI